MAQTYTGLGRVALAVASLVTGGCAAAPDDVERDMVVSGTAQALVDSDALRVMAHWSTELADNPGTFIQIEDVGNAGGSDPGAFDLEVLAPPEDALDHAGDLDQDEHAEYYYSAATLLLVEDVDVLTNGWVDPKLISPRMVGQAPYVILWVDRDMPEDAVGVFGIGPVTAGFHLLERQPDRLVTIDGRTSGAIAVWKEVPRETPIHIEVGSDGSVPGDSD